jgi:AGCS family alanine or glycine:cation symporter
MAEILEAINNAVWGLPALVMILGVGIYLTLRTGFVQLRLFPAALRRFAGMFRGSGKSSFRSLCTALGATVGTGNLVGVAGALCLGGPGSIFWMWVCGFLGMATKYAEAVLAVRYRVREGTEILGGPMYYISQGMGKKWKWLAGIYSFLGVFAAFGVGNATQVNAIAGILRTVTGWENKRWLVALGAALALLVGVLLSGGAKRIGRAAERLVPFAAGGYIFLCLAVLLLSYKRIPGAVSLIIRGAFDPKAVTGGALGSAFCALRVGCARGVFTNEAGMGTAAIAHGSAEVDHPAEQGMMGIMEVFLDTIVICTLTALVILCSGVTVPYGIDPGGQLTSAAFGAVCGDWAEVIFAGNICCFAFATILGWGLYGQRCGVYLLGRGMERWFVLGQMGAAFLGAVLETGVIWTAAETVNGLMTIPNLIALGLLSGEVAQLTREYGNSRRKE